MDDPLASWFVREILPHEGSLVRYLTRLWPNTAEIHDLRQETYVRVYEAAARARPLSPRAFLFTTARHLVVDRLRRDRIVSIEAMGDLDTSHVLIDRLSPETHVSAREELRLLAQALDLLPPRCREVVWLRRVEEISQKEVAERLGISFKTVEKHVAKGMRLMTEHLFGRGSGSSGGTEETIEHGKQYSD